MSDNRKYYYLKLKENFFEGVAGGLIDLSSGPQNGPLKAYRPLK